MNAQPAGRRPDLADRLLREALESDGGTDSWLAKRNQERMSASIPLDMEVRGRVHYVQCLNVSEAGLMVLCKHNISLEHYESGVRIRRCGDGDDAWTAVVVEHVTATVYGFKVGLAYRG